MDFTLTLPRIFENINLKEEQDVPLVDLGLYTSAAPTYFQAYNYAWKLIEKYKPEEVSTKEKTILLKAFEKDMLMQNKNFRKSSTLLDGGILENIPIVSTYTTLHNELGVEPKDIDMFVIGTGNFTSGENYTAEQVNKWSILDYALKMIVPYVTSSNEQMSVFWGLQMGFNSFTYYNPVDAAGEMDDSTILPDLKKQCEMYKDEFITEINNFLNR